MGSDRGEKPGRRSCVTRIIVGALICLSFSGGLAMAAGHRRIEPPGAKTLSAEVPVGHEVGLRGLIYPRGQWTYFWFQWGPTVHYAHSTRHEIDEGLGVYDEEEVTSAINRIRPGTIYHFRLVVQNEDGKGFGRDRRFRTRRSYARSPVGSNSGLSSAAWSLYFLK
jgi:hypothetical protein